MGNQLIKNINIEKESFLSGGVGVLWKLYKAQTTDKSKSPVVVFMYDKKMIFSLTPTAREEFLATLRREPYHLSQFKHERITNLHTPLLEDKKLVGFVTEDFNTTLHGLLHENKIEDIYSTELEAKMRIQMVAEVLKYLHD